MWFALILLVLVPVTILAMEGLGEDEWIEVILAMGAGILPAVIVLALGRFQFKVDDVGIHYRFAPQVIRWRTISGGEIQSFEIRQRKTFFERHHCGYHYNRFRHSIQMNITGKKFVCITLRNGRKVKIGSENPEEVAYALKRLHTENNF